MNMNKNTDLVSVAVPVYNVGEYLEECLDSILAQTYYRLEVILLDDGSTDRSTEICSSYEKKDTRVKVFRQQNQGPAAARKNACRKAGGKYIVFIDADDFLEKDYLEQLMEAAADFDLVTSGYMEEGRIECCYDRIGKGKYATKEQLHYIFDHMIMSESLERGITPYIWNKLYRTDRARKVFEEVGMKAFIGEDSEFLYRYILGCSSVLITDICGYHYRRREGSIVHRKHKGYLANLSELYCSLETVFSSHERKESLIKQLQLWTAVGIRNAPVVMDFSERARAVVTGTVPRYIFPFYEQANGKKIVLYGAGTVGKSYYAQLEKRNDIHIVLWTDRDEKYFTNGEYPVKPCSEITGTEFDYVVVAVKNEETAEQIKENLADIGISGDKVLWKSPVDLVL